MGGLFDLDEKRKEIKVLTLQTENGDFWDNIDEANKINQKIANLKKFANDYDLLCSNAQFYLSLCQEENEAMTEELNKEYLDLKEKYNNFELNVLMKGKYDKLSCYLEIHPGAGGTESCDWASMLLRMYERYCELKGFTYEEIDYQKGDEAGIKSVTIHISGYLAYAMFKNENGVHRLVRISPFDSNKRRHTSFASVTVIPEFDNNVSIDIKDSDLKIDVFHSSGAGGQSVNTSNSAVRITHLPTKTVVTCQTERSQLKNKDQAMKLLKNKLYKIEEEKNNTLLTNVKDTSSDINFGNQIRSYVLEPYKLIKDNRCSFESTNPLKILNGELDDLINALIRNNK